MGLDLSVGILADIDPAEELEYVAFLQQDFERINAVLRRLGLSEHREPTDPPEPWSGRVGTYSTIHELRRVAAWLRAGKGLPPPVGDDENATDDALLESYYADGPGGSWLSRTFRRKSSPPGPSFDHLVQHSDCEGYYVPVDFPDVLPVAKVAGELVGSSQRLKAECEQLAEELRLDLSLDPEAEETWDHFDSEGDEPWQLHPGAAWSCLVLHGAASHSVETGAVIVFC